MRAAVAATAAAALMLGACTGTSAQTERAKEWIAFYVNPAGNLATDLANFKKAEGTVLIFPTDEYLSILVGLSDQVQHDIDQLPAKFASSGDRLTTNVTVSKAVSDTSAAMAAAQRFATTKAGAAKNLMDSTYRITAADWNSALSSIWKLAGRSSGWPVLDES